MDEHEQQMAAHAARHPRLLGLGVPLGTALGVFVFEGGFGAGWGNILAAAVLAFSLWLGMKIVLYFLGSVPRDIPQR